MNNSKIALDNIEVGDKDKVSFLQRQQGEIAQIIEAINGVEAQPEWQKLKRLVLDGIVSALERQVSAEAAKQQINTSELYRLQGQLSWARKYADLKKLGELFKQQSESIKLSIKNEQTNPSDGAL